jgi:hypothetical protein
MCKDGVSMGKVNGSDKVGITVVGALKGQGLYQYHLRTFIAVYAVSCT